MKYQFIVYFFLFYLINLGPSAEDLAVTTVLDQIGKSKNVSLTQIALAYAIAKQPYIFPIVGIRKLEHLQDAINALQLRLTDEDIKQIENVYNFQLGFPHSFIGLSSSQHHLLTLFAHCDWVLPEKSINTI